jgi:hypothetical protein
MSGSHWLVEVTLERDDFSSNRHRALRHSGGTSGLGALA